MALGSIPTFLRAYFAGLCSSGCSCFWKHPCSLLHTEFASTAWIWDGPNKPVMHQSLLNKSPAGLTVSSFKSLIKFLALLRRAHREDDRVQKHWGCEQRGLKDGNVRSTAASPDKSIRRLINLGPKIPASMLYMLPTSLKQQTKAHGRIQTPQTR